jgi:two-component system, NtrC family, response regulator GlrR
MHDPLRGVVERPATTGSDLVSIETPTARAPIEPFVLLRQGRLRILTGAGNGREALIGPQTARVGRSVGNTLVLADPLVSAIHLELAPESRGFRLRDLGSTNGTFLGAVQVRDALLASEVAIRLGATTFEPLAQFVPVRLSESSRFGGLIGESGVMRRLFALLARVSVTDLSVLIEGESGTGKEEAARALHARSSRAGKPFVVIDCSTIPQSLAESILFGHERGAFTGAGERRLGAFESAEGGTILLDEIGEMPLSLQPKFLRVLETRQVTRVGETFPRTVDVRVLSATHRDLRKRVNEGRFRPDLYHRLAEIEVVLPPLRERRGDVVLLAEHFLARAAARAARSAPPLPPEVGRRLEEHDWPGNVRELRNLLSRLVALDPGQELTQDRVEGELGSHRPSSLDLHQPYRAARERALRVFDAGYLTDLRERHGGNLTRAAREAGLTRLTLRRLFRRVGIRVREEDG